MGGRRKALQPRLRTGPNLGAINLSIIDFHRASFSSGQQAELYFNDLQVH